VENNFMAQNKYHRTLPGLTYMLVGPYRRKLNAPQPREEKIMGRQKKSEIRNLKRIFGLPQPTATGRRSRERAGVWSTWLVCSC
jgi:hypothetical protein